MYKWMVIGVTSLNVEIGGYRQVGENDSSPWGILSKPDTSL
jgi:hypothetical protein